MACSTQSGYPARQVSVAGDTALVQETIDDATSDLWRVAPAVLAAIALVLVVFLRGLVAPLYLVAIAALAPLAATGLTVAVFQGLLGHSELTYFVPIAAGVLLVALGSDYNVFLVGRIWAEAETRPLREAIVVGGAGAARAISAAGVVLAVSFAATALVPLQAFRELAFLLAAGLLIDAFLVRSVLVPAVIALSRATRSGWPGQRLHRVAARAGRAVVAEAEPPRDVVASIRAPRAVVAARPGARVADAVRRRAAPARLRAVGRVAGPSTVGAPVEPAAVHEPVQRRRRRRPAHRSEVRQQIMRERQGQHDAVGRHPPPALGEVRQEHEQSRLGAAHADEREMERQALAASRGRSSRRAKIVRPPARERGEAVVEHGDARRDERLPARRPGRLAGRPGPQQVTGAERARGSRGRRPAATA